MIGELDLTAAVARKQDWIALQKTVLAMPEPDREIFIRRHFLLQPVREIAAAVSMNEKQVKNRLYQSRLKLKKQLIRKGVTL